MEIDTARIDAAVLALLLLGRHDGGRVWKSFDWDAMERLHKKGLISDPVGKAKSVVLTEEGQREAERLLDQCRQCLGRLRSCSRRAADRAATGVDLLQPLARGCRLARRALAALRWLAMRPRANLIGSSSKVSGS